MEEKKFLYFQNPIKYSFNSILEESDDSTEIKIASHRTRSHGKLIYSKITKKLKRHSPVELSLSLNAINSISAPRLQNVLEKQKASMSDYNVICDLGYGSYGKVILAKKKKRRKKIRNKSY